MGAATPAATDGLGTSPQRHDTPRRVRRDVRFLRLYVYTVPRTLTYRTPKSGEELDITPAESVSRIEDGLAAEAVRYRASLWAIVAILVALPLLSAFLWSGMYWLPVRIYWWPFDRGNYGLPFLSLFEWLSYLLLAAYFVVTWAILRDGHEQTRRLGAEYRRLGAADAATRDSVVALVAAGASPRTEFLLRKAPVFSAYREALDSIERP